MRFSLNPSNFPRGWQHVAALQRLAPHLLRLAVAVSTWHQAQEGMANPVRRRACGTVGYFVHDRADASST
jgi:hypothetical protein